MEAPKKIYIDDFVSLLSCNWHTEHSYENDIEYVRADALDDLINKSAVWFADKYQANGLYLCANDTEDYVQQMREYIKQKWL